MAAALRLSSSFSSPLVVPPPYSLVSATAFPSLLPPAVAVDELGSGVQFVVAHSLLLTAKLRR
jgi:hypothetical protein